jgi:hypothetical protein
MRVLQVDAAAESNACRWEQGGDPQVTGLTGANRTRAAGPFTLYPFGTAEAGSPAGRPDDRTPLPASPSRGTWVPESEDDRR